MHVIKFHLVGEDYGWLSNSAPYPISLEGVMWYTAEHYFQAHKYHNELVQREIRKQRSPLEIAKVVRSARVRVKGDWDAKKLGVMRTAVRAKFTQLPELRKLLLNTGDAVLVDHSDEDSYWSDGGDGDGRNMLGVILMEIRDELRPPSAE